MEFVRLEKSLDCVSIYNDVRSSWEWPSVVDRTLKSSYWPANSSLSNTKQNNSLFAEARTHFFHTYTCLSSFVTFSTWTFSLLLFSLAHAALTPLKTNKQTKRIADKKRFVSPFVSLIVRSKAWRLDSCIEMGTDLGGRGGGKRKGEKNQHSAGKEVGWRLGGGEGGGDQRLDRCSADADRHAWPGLVGLSTVHCSSVDTCQTAS